MKIVDIITVLLPFTYLTICVAIDEPQSYIRSRQISEIQPEPRFLQLAENFTSTCQTDLDECLARTGDGELPLNDWFEIIEGATSDPVGVSTQLLSIVQEAAVIDFKEIALEIRDNLTPDQVEEIVADSPAVIDKLKGLSASLDSITPTDAVPAELSLLLLSKILTGI